MLHVCKPRAAIDSSHAALDPGDAAAAQEQGVYERVAHSLRSAAAELHAAAEEMASAVHLPMGAHDMAAITTTDVLLAFERYVAAEDGLRRLLDARREDNEQMLTAIRREVGVRALDDAVIDGCGSRPPDLFEHQPDDAVVGVAPERWAVRCRRLPRRHPELDTVVKTGISG